MVIIGRYDPSPSLRANQMLLLHFLLLWFLLVAVAAQSASAGEHERSSSAARLRGRMDIVNGQQVIDHRYFAHQVAVFDAGRFICAGSIISPNYILTAAHCISLTVHEREFEQTNDSSVYLKKYHEFDRDPEAKTNYWDVGYGSSTANDYSSPAVKKIRVAEAWIHKNYVYFSEVFETDNGDVISFLRRSNDIAILRLISPLTFSETVRSISLSPDDSYLKPGHDLTFSGWGTMLTIYGPFPSKLQALTVEHRPDYCEELLENEAYTLLPVYSSLLNYSMWYDRKAMVCAGCPQLGSGICGGDSGGALNVLPANGGCPVQIGIAQHSFPINLTTCAMMGVEFYARLSSNLAWIEHMVKQPLRSTVVPVPTNHCETCLGNDHPNDQECQKVQKYDLTYCEVQARLASSFVLEEPTCEGGKHKLKAHIDLNKALAGISFSTMTDAKERIKNGHVIFFVTNKGTGNGVIHISSEDGHMQHQSSHTSSAGEKSAAITINTPLKKPKLASKLVSFDSKEEGWLHLVSGCSSKSTYAALYILSPHSGEDHAASKHAFYQISLPVGKVPVP